MSLPSKLIRNSNKIWHGYKQQNHVICSFIVWSFRDANMRFHWPIPSASTSSQYLQSSNCLCSLFLCSSLWFSLLDWFPGPSRTSNLLPWIRNPLYIDMLHLTWFLGLQSKILLYLGFSFVRQYTVLHRDKFLTNVDNKKGSLGFGPHYLCLALGAKIYNNIGLVPISVIWLVWQFVWSLFLLETRYYPFTLYSLYIWYNMYIIYIYGKWKKWKEKLLKKAIQKPAH